MTDSTVNLKIGTNTKKGIIHNVQIEETAKGNKIRLNVLSGDNASYKINEAWIRDHTGEIVPKTLWVSLDGAGDLLSSSVLSGFLMFHQCLSLTELVGKEVNLCSKPNGFMAVIAYS